MPVSKRLLVGVLLLCSPSFARETIDPSAPSLGISCVSLVDLLPRFKERKIDAPTKSGVFVTGVLPKGPAAEAKIPALSIVTRVNQKLLKDLSDFLATVKSLEIGKPVSVSGFISQGNRWRPFTVRATPKTWRETVFAALHVEQDAITGDRTYRHVDSPEFVNKRSELFVKCRVNQAGNPALTLNLQYVADDWLFIRNVIVKTDEKTFTLRPDDIHTDHSGGRIWEWFSTPVTATEREMLDAIVEARTVLLRCEGTDYAKDREMEWDERRLDKELTFNCELLFVEKRVAEHGIIEPSVIWSADFEGSSNGKSSASRQIQLTLDNYLRRFFGNRFRE